MKLLKQLLCKHKYLADDVSNPIVVQTKCIYCGKTKGVLREDFYKKKLQFKFR